MLPFPSALLCSAAAAGGGVSDPYFSSVKLLVGFEGANNSTTFTDESPAARALTTNGDAKITTSQFKFGTSAGAFDGSGDFIYALDSDDWSFGSGEVTVEGWFRFLVKQSSQALIGQWGDAANQSWFFYISGGNLLFRMAFGTTLKDVSAAFVPTLGSWYHLAADRDASGVTRIYVNGAMLTSGATQSGFTVTNSNQPLTLGRIWTSTTFASFDFNGNMDEVRYTKGVARYASDAGFTVPAAAFPRS